MRAAEVEERLNILGVHPDKVFKHKGEFKARFSYFYTFGRTASSCADRIKEALPQATIYEATDNWNAWPKGSYFEVRFGLE